MPTTTELTEKYLAEHSSIKDCLKKGVINYSKLARKIAVDLKIQKKMSMEAILVACRRYGQKLKKEMVVEDQILKLLKNSELMIRNKIAVVVIKKEPYLENLLNIEKKIRNKADVFYGIEVTNAFVIILSQKYLKELNELFKGDIIKVLENLAMITIKGPEELEETPGTIAYLGSFFSDHKINVIEHMSCWTDIIFVISEDDVPKIMKSLRF